MNLLTRTANRMTAAFASGYDAVKSSGKRKAASSVLKHEDQNLKNADRHRMIGATRDMARNFSIVAWAIRKHLDYVSLFDFQMRTQSDELNQQIETLMKDWQRPSQCDAAGRHSFSKMLRMVESRRTIDGDVMALKLQGGQIQVIEADRIRQPDKIEQGDRWYNGIRVNRAGASAQYALWNRTDSSQFKFARNVPARRMIHHGHFERFDQVRGISPLAAALNSFRDCYESIDLALAKMKVEQLFALVFYRDAEESIGAATGTDANGYEIDFGKGPVQLDLDPGDKAEFLKTDNPGSNTREFMQTVLSIAIKSLDLPYNFVDESHTNFFGSRAAWLLYDRSCQHKRADVLEFLRKVTVWKLQQWVINGQLQLPAGQTIRDMPFEWVHRGMPWWDPAKEINGAVAAIKAGLDNPYRITKEAGRGEFEENVDAIAKANAYAEERGVTLEYAMQPVVEEPPPEPNNTRGAAVMKKDISKQPQYLRASVARGAESVDRSGGTFGAGVIRGVSVITRGEALGHEMWIDQDFLSDVTAAINGSEAASGGIKARFTHPGLSSDGMASKLGRITDAKTIGDRVVADLNFAEFATKTPDGDLADYVMSLAEEDPESFGLSIVFEFDQQAMNEHETENTSGKPARFVSPDEDNRNNFQHARLTRLRAGDVVDEPAANPNGLFHREQEIAQEADRLMEYALGLSGEKPECACLSVDADRVSAAVSRFLSRHDLTLVTKGDDMPKDETPADVPATETQLSSEDVRKEFASELSRFTESFGATSAAEWVAEGLSFSDAQSRHIGALNAKIDALQAKVGELQETLNSIDTGDREPAEYGEGNDSPQPKRGGLSSKIRISGRSYEDN